MKQLAVVGLLVALVGLSGCAHWPAPRAARLTLASQGHTAYVITLAREHSAAEQYAAEELARFLKQVTGAEFAIVTPAERGRRPTIAVGAGAACRVAPDLNLAGLGSDVAAGSFGAPGVPDLRAGTDCL